MAKRTLLLVFAVLVSCSITQAEPPTGVAVSPAVQQSIHEYSQRVSSKVSKTLQDLGAIEGLMIFHARIWTGDGTKIKRSEVQSSNVVLNQRLTTALLGVDLGPKPPGLPDPITLRITARPPDLKEERNA